MLDENEHSRKEDGRSLHRLLHKAEQQDATVVVDSAAFFSELPPEQAAPPRRPQQNIPRSTVPGANGAYQPPKRGKILLIVQAILSVLALVQLWRTQMLPVLYLVVLAALLVLLWLLVKRCQEYKTAGTVSRAFSVVLCAAMAIGCVWAQQGLDAGGELAKREGLDQIVVCAAREPLDAVVDRVARREHEDRRGEARGAKPSGERHAVGVGQPHVEDDEVEGRAVDALEGLEPRGGRLGRPAVLHGKEVADVGKDVGIVVDDENADAHESASFLISLPAGMLRLAACARHCAALDRLSVRSHLGRRVVDCTPSMPSTVE